MQERLDDGRGTMRAAVRLGGRSIAHHQVDLALTLECQRIICLAPALDPELIKLQRLAEAAGARFHVLPGTRSLAGLITAVDEVVAIADGLFVAADPLPELLGRGSAVLVQPIDQGLTRGFERIDLNHASAGLMRVPGRLVAGLMDMPDDCDAFSALQRIALQAAVPQKSVPDQAASPTFWALVRTQAEADQIEPVWLNARTAHDRAAAPGEWLARLAARAFGSAVLDAAGGSAPLAIGAALLIALGLGTGWFGHAAIGLGLCGTGWIIWKCREVLGRVELGRRGQTAKFAVPPALLAVLFDAALVALCGWGIEPGAGPVPYAHYFAPVMLVALLRLVPRTIHSRLTPWIEDRALACAIIAGGIGLGYGNELVHFTALALAAAGIALPRAQTRLT